VNKTDALLSQILRRDRTIAIVGLSANEHRPSHVVATYLQAKGYRIVPVNPRYADDQILSEPVYATLEQIPFAVDMVDVFRKPADVLPIAQSAIAIGAKTLWQQLDIANTEADAAARDAGLDSVMDRCTKIEHARLYGDLHWEDINNG
jgi:predicted CoA-binding protein